MADINKSNKHAKDVTGIVEREKDPTVFIEAGKAINRFFEDKLAEVQSMTDKEKKKPKYRFLDNNNKLMFLQENIQNISRLQNALDNMNLQVDIFENLDCMNVTNENRYFIRITNKNGVYVDTSLLEYERNIIDFAFDEQEFWERLLNKIVGNITKEIKEQADIIAEYISYIMYIKEMYNLTYKKIGWEYYNWNYNGWIFKYDRIYTHIPLLRGECNKNYIDGLEETNNNEVNIIDKWMTNIKYLLNNYSYDALLMGAGISGLIRQLLPYTKETNININIVGNPGSGKSTIEHYILSIFGNPERLEGNFSDTDNRMEEIRVQRPILPYILDERMLKIEGDSDNAKKKKLLLDVFREYEGKVKERVGKQYEETSGERTYGPIISSSVESMMKYLYEIGTDLGQFRRFIEFDIKSAKDKILFGSPKEAKDTEDIAYKYYGVGIRIIIEYMLKLLEHDDDCFKARFNEIDKKIEKRLKEEEESQKLRGLSSSSKRFALIVLSYQVLRESLIYFETDTVMNFVPESDTSTEQVDKIMKLKKKYAHMSADDIIKDKSDEVIDILVDNIVKKMERVGINICDIVKESDKFIEQRTITRSKEVMDMLQSGEKHGAYYIDKSKNKMIITLLRYSASRELLKKEYGINGVKEENGWKPTSTPNSNGKSVLIWTKEFDLKSPEITDKEAEEAKK